MILWGQRAEGVGAPALKELLLNKSKHFAALCTLPTLSEVTYFLHFRHCSWWVLVDGPKHVSVSFRTTEVSFQSQDTSIIKSWSDQPLAPTSQSILLAVIVCGPGFLNLGERTVILCASCYNEVTKERVLV